MKTSKDNHREPDKEARLERLRNFMAEHDITYSNMGKYLGMCPASVRYSLRTSISAARRKQYLDLGFPEDTLPPVASRRPREPLFPGLADKAVLSDKIGQVMS